MNIREIHENKKQFLSFLLLADEQENMVDRYLEKSTMYVLDDYGAKAECVVTDECGFLRKSGDILEPQIVTVEFKEWEKYRNLLRGYYDSVEDVCNGIAVELHDYMVSHIQKHLLNAGLHIITM